MRRLFLVLAKLMGLFQLYQTIYSGYILISFLAEHLKENLDLASTLCMVCYIVLLLPITWILLFRTEWLADRLGIQDDGEIGGPEKFPVLLVGVKLIGVYITAYAIPSLVTELPSTLAVLKNPNEGTLLWHAIIPAVLQVVIGLFLALKSDYVVKIITKKKELTEQS